MAQLVDFLHFSQALHFFSKNLQLFYFCIEFFSFIITSSLELSQYSSTID